MSNLMPLDPKYAVVIDYTNYRGERRMRRIQPLEGGIKFGAMVHS
jgi:hypothetical protein